MSLQSNSQPGNKISACRYFLDGSTSHPRHRDRVNSSSKCISSRMFFTSLKGIGMSSNFLPVLLLVIHTCEEEKGLGRKHDRVSSASDSQSGDLGPGSTTVFASCWNCSRSSRVQICGHACITYITNWLPSASQDF